jgi:hypothetical protein
VFRFWKGVLLVNFRGGEYGFKVSGYEREGVSVVLSRVGVRVR